MTALRDRPIGIYEKALAAAPWPAMLAAARSAGFAFLEMSIDESDDRLARLEWSSGERRELARICAETEIPIFSICLSGHRRFGLGSPDPLVRARAAGMLDAAIGLASDLGARIVQVAGYYSFYEPTDADTRARYIDGLRIGVERAASRGVMLALENIDTPDMASVRDCIAVRDEIASPWFQIYPDVGNLALHGLDVESELALLPGSAVGLHLKDTRPGEPRRVPFGRGTVPFRDVFITLNALAYDGPLTIEMWNDDPRTATRTARAALNWIRSEIENAMTDADVIAMPAVGSIRAPPSSRREHVGVTASQRGPKGNRQMLDRSSEETQ